MNSLIKTKIILFKIIIYFKCKLHGNGFMSHKFITHKIIQHCKPIVGIGHSDRLLK